MFDKTINNYLKSLNKFGSLYVKESAIDKLPLIDSMIFDYDGVLVDVSDSIMQVHNITADLYFKKFGWYNTESIVTDVHVELFKLAGGFNNDWDLAYAWALFFWVKHYLTGSVNGDVLSDTIPTFEDYISDIAVFGGGLKSMSRVLNSWCGIEEIDKIQTKCNRDELIYLFKQVYSGDLAYEMYGFNNDMYHDQGLINKDIAIFDAQLVLHSIPVGIATGRSSGEANTGIRLMGWNCLFPENCVITEDDGFLKPDPKIIDLVVGRLNSDYPIYFGDTPDDLLTVNNYRNTEHNIISCMVTTGLKNPGLVDIFSSQNADIIADNVNTALIYINNYIGG